MSVPIKWVTKVKGVQRESGVLRPICEWMFTCLGTVLGPVGPNSSRCSVSAWLVSFRWTCLCLRLLSGLKWTAMFTNNVCKTNLLDLFLPLLVSTGFWLAETFNDSNYWNKLPACLCSRRSRDKQNSQQARLRWEGQTSSRFFQQSVWLFTSWGLFQKAGLASFFILK